MVFSATFACARCRLRFARRTQCPECGGGEIFALLTPGERARYRAAVAARTPRALGGGTLIGLAPWAPRRPLIPIGGGILAMIPAVVSEGASLTALAVAGAMVAIAAILATLGGRSAASAAAGSNASASNASTSMRMRVFQPPAVVSEATDDTAVTGVARRASIEIAGPLSDEPCLVFGVCGEIGDADIADADGGDFDVELSSGERVMISLEHAILEAAAPGQSGPAASAPRDITAALGELLEPRAVDAADAGDGHADRKATLEEHLVRDGDTVTVIGRTLGGTVTSLGNRGSSKTRVLSGNEDRPLIVRCAALLATASTMR